MLIMQKREKSGYLYELKWPTVVDILLQIDVQRFMNSDVQLLITVGKNKANPWKATLTSE